MSAPELDHPLAAAIAAALGPGVVVAAAPIDPEPLFRFEHEALAVAEAVPKRVAEFATGRRLAHVLCAELGAADQPLTVLRNRAPAWGRDVVGSISHSDELCAVALARASEVQRLAIDIEPDLPLERDLWASVLTPTELERLGSAGPLAGHAVRAAFSAKECYWKLIADGARRMLDLREVEVQFDAATAQRFEVRALDSDLVPRGMGRVAGSIVRAAGHLACSARY